MPVATSEAQPRSVQRRAIDRSVRAHPRLEIYMLPGTSELGKLDYYEVAPQKECGSC